MCIIKICLFLFVLIGLGASQNETICWKNGCDIYTKTTSIESSLSQWFLQSNNNTQETEERIWSKIDNHHNNMKSHITTSFGKQSSCPNNITQNFDKKLELINQKLNEKLQHLINLLENKLGGPTPTGSPTIHPPLNCLINDCWDKPDFIGEVTIFTGERIMCMRGWISVMFVDVNRHLNVNKTWNEYEHGFGTKTGSHWTGLKLISEIMSRRPKWQLKFTAVDRKTPFLHMSGIYDDFRLVDDDYKLHVGSYRGERLYNVLKCTSYGTHYRQNGLPFSTKDKDKHSLSSQNYAINYGGGFWYNNPGCLLQYHNRGYVGSLRTCYSHSSERHLYYLRQLSLEIRPY